MDDLSSSGSASKPVLDISLPLHEVVDTAEKHLATEPSVFQKSGELVSVIKEKGVVDIRPIKTPLARYLLSRVASWVSVSGEETRSVAPPGLVASCLLGKASWSNVRPLRAVATFPPLSSGGELTTQEGYDPHTNVYFTGQIDCKVPSRPTLENAKSATRVLLDIVCDFPFAGEAHRSAWLAALLSPLSRFAHDGNIPIVVVQANSPRVGKTTLVKLISYIVSGTECPVITHTKNEDEERKRILSYLRSTRAVVLVDNVVGQYGGASINALATSRIFEDRVLGSSSVIKVVNDATWFITGNNITLAPDTAERCLNIRLMCDDEKPHLRSGFSHADLWGMVRDKRTEYLCAALTILKAYIIAGSPDQNLPAWGSFEPWSKVVRGALVWAGLPDPANTRTELEEDADVERFASATLIEGWQELQEVARRPDGLTSREARLHLMQGLLSPKLRDAFRDITGGERLPSTATISRHLRELRDRNFGGKVLKCHPSERTAHRWYVESVKEQSH